MANLYRFTCKLCGEEKEDSSFSLLFDKNITPYQICEDCAEKN